MIMWMLCYSMFLFSFFFFFFASNAHYFLYVMCVCALLCHKVLEANVALGIIIFLQKEKQHKNALLTFNRPQPCFFSVFVGYIFKQMLSPHDPQCETVWSYPGSQSSPLGLPQVMASQFIPFLYTLTHQASLPALCCSLYFSMWS